MLAVIATMAGCQPASRTVETPADPSMLRGVVSTYATAARNLGRPPQNIDELKAILAPVSDDPSQYFRSSRDGQEFVVVWGLSFATTPPDTIVAYERTGVDGKRMVVTINRDILEVTPEEFARLKLPKDQAPGG